MRRLVCRNPLRNAVNQNPRRDCDIPLHPHHLHRSLQTTPIPTPPRKQLKDAAKQRKQALKAAGGSPPSRHPDPSSAWELTVGIEIHARLNTSRKLFSGATSDAASADPNRHVAAFDASAPGTRPRLQRAALVPALRAALALKCEPAPSSRWDRKHYFYQDQPAGYQITQFFSPLARHGSLSIPTIAGAGAGAAKKEVRIRQVQLEQDTAKSTATTTTTTVGGPTNQLRLLDLNRVGCALVEIISDPCLHSPAEAGAFVRRVRDVLRHVDACEGNMERGDLRADVNVSVRRRGTGGAGQSYAGVEGLGTRTEIKNLNSIRAVEEAVRAERDRQIGVLEGGGVVEGETRGWVVGGTETTRLRGKEGEVDYRYLPDPDLGPVWIGDEVVEMVRATLPEEMETTVGRIMRDFGLSEKDAWTLFDMDDGERLEFAADVADRLKAMLAGEFEAHGKDSVKVSKTVANWVLHEIGGILTTNSMGWENLKVTVEDLATILQRLLLKQITGRSAKQLLQLAFDGETSKRSIDLLIDEKNLRLRPMDQAGYENLAQQILDENPDAVVAIKDKGQRGKVMFFVGQMMRQGDEGTVEADNAKAVLEKLLGLP